MFEWFGLNIQPEVERLRVTLLIYYVNSLSLQIASSLVAPVCASRVIII